MTHISNKPRWEIWLNDPYGNRLSPLETFTQLTLIRVINNIGAFSLTFPESEIDTSLLSIDGIVEFWRSYPGQNPKIITVGFIREIIYSENESGIELVTLNGVDTVELLDRRIIAYPANSSESSKTDNADDMMKAIVRENLGSSAVAGRDLSSLNFSVDADENLGTSLTKSFSWKNVLSTLREISDTTVQDGNPIYFDIVPYEVSNTAIGFIFKTFQDQPGLDKSYSSSDPVFFGKEWGNVANPTLNYNYFEERNYVYVGGQGDEAERTIEEVSDSDRVNLSPWNRRELFSDARNESTVAGLQTKGKAELDDKKPITSFAIDLLNTPQAKYGVDWEFGYKVTVTFKEDTFDGLVKTTTFAIDNIGNETISARFEA